MRRERKRFKACRKCKALNSHDAQQCWNCGGNIFTIHWDGFVMILSEESELMEVLGVDKVGYYAIKII